MEFLYVVLLVIMPVLFIIFVKAGTKMSSELKLEIKQFAEKTGRQNVPLKITWQVFKKLPSKYKKISVALFLYVVVTFLMSTYYCAKFVTVGNRYLVSLLLCISSADVGAVIIECLSSSWILRKNRQRRAYNQVNLMMPKKFVFSDKSVKNIRSSWRISVFLLGYLLVLVVLNYVIRQ